MVDRIYKHLPKNKLGRIIVGMVLIFLGFLGFLPILGFWMIPLGIAVLAFDLEFARVILRKTRDGLTWLRLRLDSRRRSDRY